jgi:hypothetical protein
MESITPYGHTPSVGIRRNTFQGDPLSLLLFDLIIEPLIRWLRASYKGNDISSCGLQLASKWHARDGTLITNSVEDMIVLLDLVNKISKWFGIHLNVSKCKITAFLHDLQAIPRKRNRDDALRARLAHVTMAGRAIDSLIQDEPLPRGCLGISRTASLCPYVHIRGKKEHVKKIGKALTKAPLPPHIKQRLLLYGVHSKIAHTMLDGDISGRREGGRLSPKNNL